MANFESFETQFVKIEHFQFLISTKILENFWTLPSLRFPFSLGTSKAFERQTTQLLGK